VHIGLKVDLRKKNDEMSKMRRVWLDDGRFSSAAFFFLPLTLWVQILGERSVWRETGEIKLVDESLATRRRGRDLGLAF